MNSQEERRSHWQKVIEEQTVSGLSRRDFCQQRNIVPSKQPEIKVLMPNGLKVFLPCSDMGQMKRWLEALKSC